MAENKLTKMQSAPQGKTTTASQPETPEQTSKKSERNFILICILLFAFMVGAFWTATRNDFFYWYGDDPGYVTENIHVKNGMTLEGIKWAFCNIGLGNWHPLTFLSHMLDCQIYGLEPWGHHLTSVLLHAANAVLLFVVLRRMTGSACRSLAVTLLFGFHPLRVESVAWVAERKDVLAAFFWILTLLTYVHYAEEIKVRSSKSKKFYVLALAGFACGLMSKGIVVTLPFALLLLDYWPLKRYEQKNAGTLLLEKVPFFCLAIATSVITFMAQKNWGFVQTAEKYSLAARLENAAVSYARYVGKMFWPMDLCGYYPHPGKWPLALVLFSVTFVLGISVSVIVVRRTRPWLPVGWFWYLGTLIPVIGIVQLGDVAMADRYSYLPMIGILVALVWGLEECTKHLPYRTGIGAALTAAVLFSFIAITMKQIGYFKNSVIAWRHNFEVTGDVDVAQHALGMSLDKQGHTEEAIKELQAVLRSRPERADVQFNLATMLQVRGRMDEANHHYSEAIRIAPGHVAARGNLGLNFWSKGLTNDAIVQFQEIIKLNQDFNAYNYLGAIMLANGNLDEAIKYFGKAVEQKPYDINAQINLGSVLSDKGRFDEATQHSQEALRLDPNSTGARAFSDYLEKKKMSR